MSSQERMPLVSVVVPTRNRAAHLRVLLAALEAQDYPRHEVVVVDDASTDGTVSVLAAWEQEGKVVLRQRASGGGYAARNRGWKAARGEIIAFTDDDCVPQPGWLPALVAAFWGDPEIIGVQGRTMVGAGEVTPFTHQIEQLHGGPPYRTCNIAYRRSMLEQVGGFRDDLRWYADNILGLDALRLGKLAFAPEAVVHHPPRARDWRNRNDWIARFSADAEHRRHLQRHGLEPAIPVRALPVVLWMVRPLLKQSASHVRFALAHPARYLDELRPMMAEKRALLSAIRNRDSLAGSATLEPRGLPALPDQPLVSVLIVTRDRAGALESLLQELKSQTWT
ncbi:MAG: glycosyltransferase family 2 protein, partial [Chloroflexota bacterium]